MLDLLFSFFHLLVLTIKTFISKFVFRPPDPQGYKPVINSKNPNQELVHFLRNIKLKKYEPIKFSPIEYFYKKIPDESHNAFIPILVIKPYHPFDICIIYSHGNSGDIGTCLLEAVSLSLNTYCCVVSYEYPGYGECKDIPLNEENVYYNIIKTYEYARDTLKFRPEHIVLYGFSLGTGISFDLATRPNFPIAGLILQAPFLSILRTMYNIKQSKFFDFFCSIDKAKRIQCPVMIIHGIKDSIVPYVHGRILAKLIPKQFMYEFVTVDGADHNNVFKINKELVYKKVRNFLERVTNVNLKGEEGDDDNNNFSRSENKNNGAKCDNEEQNLNDIHLNIIGVKSPRLSSNLPTNCKKESEVEIKYQSEP